MWRGRAPLLTQTDPASGAYDPQKGFRPIFMVLGEIFLDKRNVLISKDANYT
jgi:hypothetical protein